MHIPTFRTPTIRQVQQLIQCGDYAFSIDLKDDYLHIPIVKHQCHFYDLFGKICLISRKFYPSGWPHPLGFSLPSLSLSCSFISAKVSTFSFFLDDIYVLNHSTWAGRRVHSFLCSLLVLLGLHIKFSKYDLCLTQTFCFFTIMLGYGEFVSFFTSW